MRYRIISNGVEFKVEFCHKFWPFWLTVKTYYHEFSNDKVFATKEEAESYILREKARDELLKREWKPV